MTRSVGSVIVLLVAATAAAPRAQESPLTADQIVERHLEALGGLDKIRAIQTLRKTGTYVYNGLEHPLTVYLKRGARCREEIDGLHEWGTTTSPGKTAVRVAHGDQAWVVREADSSDVRPLEGAELSAFLRDAQLETPLADYRAKGHRVALVGDESLEGVLVYHLRLTLADGGSEDWYLDKSTFLLIQRSRELPQEDFQSPTSWYYDDYREVAGVKIPYFVQIEEKIFARDYLFDTVDVNVPLDDALFASPAAPE